MIGLKRHKVKITDHDPKWLELGQASCQAIINACQNIPMDVQHVGSTSVPGLPAKPILDIVIGLEDMGVINQVRKYLEPLGYIYRRFDGDTKGHLLVRESSPDVRTEHVHVIPYKGPKWNSYIQFRDALREDRVLLDQYAELKRGLHKKFPDDREKYTAGKHDFISAGLAGIKPGAGVNK